MNITYTVSVTMTRPVGGWTCDETPQEHADAADWMQSAEAKRELEKEILQALKKLDGDCDCEIMETARETTQAEDDEPRSEDRLQALADRGCDTWAEYRGER